MNNKIFEPNLWNVESLFDVIYNVPVYQRPYSWDKEEVDILLNDIYDAYTSKDKNQGYFIGNILIFDKKDKIEGLKSRYDIIDGQQRITTLTLFLLSIYSIANYYNAPESDHTMIMIKKSLWKYVNREYKKENRVLNLNSIEKDCFTNLFDSCFSNKNTLVEFSDVNNVNNKFEKRIIDNYNHIIYFIKENILVDNEIEDLLKFADYLLSYIQVIVINAKCNENKVFTLFESLNSKGKKLEEIDLIKSYIFSKLDPVFHDKYLRIWGDLIIKTEDKLYDYLQIYIKSYIKFFNQNIKILNFKIICKDELEDFYGVSSESAGIKKLLDELYFNVEIFQMLESEDKVFEFIGNKKFKFYYKVYNKFNYVHPKPLFFRVLREYKEELLSKEDVVNIFEVTLIFLIKFLAISKRDSKDVISAFREILQYIQDLGSINYDYILYFFNKNLNNKGISDEKLKSDLFNADMYKSSKELTVTLLALYDSVSKNNKKIHISYDQAFNIIDNYGAGKSYSIDHILAQKPKEDSELKYRENKEEGTLILLKGHDFPVDKVYDNLDYDIFVSRILNNIGNLKLLFTDKNSSKNNNICNNFNCYSDIEKRANEIIDLVIDKCLKVKDTNITEKQVKTKKQNQKFILMDKIIELGFLSKGDKVYINLKPENSEAVVIDYKYVNYLGKKMTFNEWGCLVTGWSSIRIYEYTCIVGEEETLQDKRVKYKNKL